MITIGHFNHFWSFCYFDHSSRALIHLISILFLFFTGLMSRNNKESKRMLKVILDLVAVGAQATGFFIWPIVEFGRGHTKIWTVPVAIFLVSAGWWENYVDRKSPISFIKNLGRIKDRLKKTRYFVYSFISILKILFFFSASLLFLYFNGVSIGNFTKLF